MIYLVDTVDTNVLLRYAFPNDAAHGVAVAALTKLFTRGDIPVVFPQVIAEFRVVVTRPVARYGYGSAPPDADRLLDGIERFCPLMVEPPDSYLLWRRFVVQHGVSGKPTHDARLAAVAIAAGVPNVLTFNTGDFARYAADGLNVIDPAAV